MALAEEQEWAIKVRKHSGGINLGETTKDKYHGTGAMATKRIYSKSLQDVARSIVRVEGVRR